MPIFYSDLFLYTRNLLHERYNRVLSAKITFELFWQTNIFSNYSKLTKLDLLVLPN